MRRIKGIVRTVVAIAGAISLNSPMMVTVAAGSGQGLTSELNGRFSAGWRPNANSAKITRMTVRVRIDGQC